MPSLVTRAALADSVEPLIVAKPTVRMPAPCDANPPMIEESLTIKLPPTLSVDHDRDRRCPEDVRGVEVARRRVRLGRARVPLGLRRAVSGPRRQPATDTRGPLVPRAETA